MSTIRNIISFQHKESSDKFIATKKLKFDGAERTYTSDFLTLGSYRDGKQKGKGVLKIENANDHYDVTLEGTFKNGRIFDGDHFVAMAWLVRADGTKIEAIRVQRGLDGRLNPFSGPRTGRAKLTVDITNEEFSSIAHIVISLGYRNIVDDHGNWFKALELIKEFMEEDETATPGTPPIQN